MMVFRNIIRRRKKTIIISFLAIVIPSVMMAVILPSIYVSGTTVRVRGPQMRAIPPEILKRTNLLNVIARFNLYPDFRNRFSIERILEEMRNDIRLEVIDTGVNGRETDQTSSSTVTFTLTYEGRDPYAVRNTANELISLYIEENLESRVHGDGANKAAFALLEKKVGDQRETIKRCENNISALRRAHAGETPEYINSFYSSISGLKRELNRYDARILSFEKKKIGFENKISVVDPVHPGTRKKIKDAERPLKKLRAKLIELQVRWRDNHPNIIKLKKEIQVLEARVKEVTLSAQGKQDNPAYIGLKTQIESCRHEIADLKSAKTQTVKEIGEYHKKIANAFSIEKELKTLNFELREATARYEETANRLNEAKDAFHMAKVPEDQRIEVLEFARLPDHPHKPERLMIILIGLGLFIVSGGGIVWIREKLDNSIKTVKQLQNISGAPVLSTVPTVMNDEELRAQRLKTVLAIFFTIFVIIGTFFVVHLYLIPLSRLLEEIRIQMAMLM